MTKTYSQYFIWLLIIIELKYNTNLKICKAKFNRNACEVTLLLSSERCVRSFHNKDILEIVPFLSNNCRKTVDIRTETEIVNPCINISIYF